MRLWLVLLFLVTIESVGAQSTSVDGGALKINTSRLTAIETIPFENYPGLQGQVYLTEEFHAGRILLGRMLITKLRFRYDVHNDLFEIMVEGSIRYLNGIGVKEFVVNQSDENERRFLRTTNLLDQTDYNGYFELLIEDSISLLAQHYNLVLPSNYIPGIEVGNRAEQSVIKVRYFFLTFDNELIEIKRKKELVDYYQDRGFSLRPYMKEHKIDLRKEQCLRKLTRHLNDHLND